MSVEHDFAPCWLLQRLLFVTLTQHLRLRGWIFRLTFTFIFIFADSRRQIFIPITRSRIWAIYGSLDELNVAGGTTCMESHVCLRKGTELNNLVFPFIWSDYWRKHNVHVHVFFFPECMPAHQISDVS